MRKTLKSLFKFVAAAFGLGLFASGGQATTLPTSTTIVLNCEPEQGLTRQELIDCACREALRANRIEALEDFLHRYGNEDGACAARVRLALNQFASDNDYIPPKDPPDIGPYGQ